MTVVLKRVPVGYKELNHSISLCLISPLRCIAKRGFTPHNSSANKIMSTKHHFLGKICCYDCLLPNLQSSLRKNVKRRAPEPRPLGGLNYPTVLLAPLAHCDLNPTSRANPGHAPVPIETMTLNYERPTEFAKWKLFIVRKKFILNNRIPQTTRLLGKNLLWLPAP